MTPDPVQPGGPPLWVAATSRAGALAGGPLRHPPPAPGRPLGRARPLAGRAAASGRDPGDYRVGIIRGVFVTDDVERDWPPVAAAERYRRDVYVKLIKAAGDNLGRGSGPREPIPLNPLEWTVGDVEHCVAELSGFIADHGVTDLVTWGGPPGLPPSVMNASLERFAREVVPRLRTPAG